MEKTPSNKSLASKDFYPNAILSCKPSETVFNILTNLSDSEKDLMRSMTYFEEQVIFFHFLIHEFQKSNNSEANIIASFLNRKSSTVSTILQNMFFVKKKFGGQSLLTEEEKRLITDFIINKQANSLPPTYFEIQTLLFNYSQREYSLKQPQDFVMNNTHFRHEKAKPIESERGLLEKEKLQKYVEATAELLNNEVSCTTTRTKKLSLQPPSMVLNIDECGFIPFVDCSEQLVVFDPAKPCTKQIAVDRNCKRITLLGGIWADGTKTKPLIITHRKTIPNDVFRYLGEDSFVVAHQEKGFLNKEIFYLWLHVILDKELKERRKKYGDIYCVLIMDGFGAHVTSEVTNWASRHKVILHLLCPHSSHLSQPLDLVIFGAQKKFIKGKIVEKIMAKESSAGFISKEDALEKVKAKKKKEVVNTLFDDVLTKAQLSFLTTSDIVIQIVSVISSWNKATSVENIISAFARAGYVREFKADHTILKFDLKRAHLIQEYLNIPEEEDADPEIFEGSFNTDLNSVLQRNGIKPNLFDVFP